MKLLDAVHAKARGFLVMRNERGEEFDLFLWEYALRVAKTGQLIAELPDVRRMHPSEVVIAASALFHESGWMARIREGRASRFDVLNPRLGADVRQVSAQCLEDQLADVLDRRTLEAASAAVRTMHERRATSVEARIVSDARNLCEFGVLGRWSSMRRHMVDGRGLDLMLRRWHTEQDFRYWEGRLADSFHFESVRSLAERRLRGLERLMSDVQMEHNADDLRMLLASTDASAAAS